MSPLRRLERSLQPYAIQNLTLILIAGQVLIYIAMIAKPEIVGFIELRPAKVLQGEVWRMFSFLLVPRVIDPMHPFTIFTFFIAMSALHFTGSALEATWGSLRYNLFLLVGYLSSVGSAVLMSVFWGADVPASNVYFYTSIALAFALLFPDFKFSLYFLIPVKAKWLALIILAGMFISFVFGLATFTQGGWLDCVLILAANLNISLFLGRDIAERLRRGNARMIRKFGNLAQQPAGPRHTCAVCGATERTNPEREFRYCTQCEGTPGYCDLHLAGHTHRVPGAPPQWAGKKQ